VTDNDKNNQNNGENAMNISLLDLWMPILLGTVLAWIASALLHVALKFHNADYKRLSNEDEVMAAIKAGSPGLGVHPYPYCIDMKDMQDEAMQKKFADGPVGMLTVFPDGMPNMGKAIGQQILFFLIGNIIIAYCAMLALAPGADYMAVFRLVAAVGFLTYGWAQIPMSIWYGHLWPTTAKYLLDALIYGLIVAGSFAWLWPAAGA